MDVIQVAMRFWVWTLWRSIWSSSIWGSLVAWANTINERFMLAEVKKRSALVRIRLIWAEQRGTGDGA